MEETSSDKVKPRQYGMNDVICHTQIPLATRTNLEHSKGLCKQQFFGKSLELWNTKDREAAATQNIPRTKHSHFLPKKTH